jgi:hypothetical protein
VYPQLYEVCRSACEARVVNLGSDRLCFEGGPDCSETCIRAEYWMQPFRETALVCLAEDYLCYESLADCTLRRSPDQGLELQLQIVGDGWQAYDGVEVRAAQRPGNAPVERSFVPEPARAQVGDGGFELSISVWAQAYGGLAIVWFDLNGDGQCGVGDMAGQVWFNFSDEHQMMPEPVEHPLTTGRLTVVFEQRDLALTRVTEADRATWCPAAL